MSAKSSANRFTLDALTVFRASGLTTVGASGGSTGAIGASGVSTGYLTLDQLAAYWNTGDNANLEQFAVVCQIESLGSASGAPSVSFKLRISTDASFSSPAPIVEVTGPTYAAAVNQAVLVLTREQINDALTALSVSTTTPTPVYLDVYMTLGGTTTTPAVAWNAYAAPIPGNS